ncbi:MAG: hypothetical protein GWP16_01405 [Nitrospirae bacterium]|nr:hypothetical protein [Nitrospirota bacterium]
MKALFLIALPDDGMIVNVASDTGKVVCPNIVAPNQIRGVEDLPLVPMLDCSEVQTDSFPPPKSGKFKLLERQVLS